MNYDELTDRELDELISHRLFGIEPLTEGQKKRGIIFRPSKYSSDISKAFEVVEAMRERELLCQMTNCGGRWSVRFWGFSDSGRISSEVFDDPLSRAICIAALRALE